ncbi:MAG: sigma-54 dependent transcriptional regulator [Candidatus Poribacteria bacterium]|nr:sigma-54 dependent transcriptional regulator [Candidatus Poribacteria bacterium]
MTNMQDKGCPIKLPSAAMQEVYSRMERFALTKVPILITGDTGVGKEIIAHEIHKMSPRSTKPFKVINCSAFPDNGLLNSEIFGHEKGAFTGATHQRKGLFEQAHTGTLFLDEIGDMDVEVQPKFLRVLEEQEFTRLGGNRLIKTDVRVIAATNKNLKPGRKNNQFRQDLYYRLSLCDIHIPPLREHREDILPLVKAFLAEFSAKYEKSVTNISLEVRNFLKHAAWPGNIRQLRNAIERAVILTKTDEIKFSDLPADIAIVPQVEISECPSDTSESTAIPTEIRQILAQISVTEFILIFGGIPNAVWRMLPEKTQRSVIREASFHLSALLGGHQEAIWINGMDRDQILGKIAQRRIKEHGSLVQAAKSLGIDRRTLKAYTQTDDTGE